MCNTRPLSSSSTVFVILLSSKLCTSISLAYKASLGKTSSFMSFSQLLKDLQRLCMRSVDLLTSMRVMRHRPLVCRCLSLIRRALDGCSQQKSEYYPHPGWKRSRFLHHQSRSKTRASSHCMMRGLQKVKREISFSFRMMTLIWTPKAQSPRRSFKNSKLTFITCLSTWKEPSG